MRRVLREPLFQFLVGGALLYFLHAAISEPESVVIEVSENTLVPYLLTKRVASDADSIKLALHSLERKQLDELIDRYVQEEMLYREALSLGLDRIDGGVRQMLVQQSERILLSEIDSRSVSESEARDYFAVHRDRFMTSPSLTFAHVFLDRSLHGPRAEQLATNLAQELNRTGAVFTDAPAFGDRFSWHVNYVDRPLDLVESHLGADMTAELIQLEPSTRVWHGPLQSPHGWHVVMIAKNLAAEPMTFDLARALVEAELIDERKVQLRVRAMDELRRKYRIRVDLAVPRAESAVGG